MLMLSSQISPDSFDVKKKHAVVHLLVRKRVYTVCLHLEQTFETVLEEMKLDTEVLEETFTLKLELVLFQT